MRCSKCGYDNLDGMKYCVSCAAELLTPEQRTEKVEENKKSVIILYIIIGLLVVLLIGLIVYLLMGGGSAVPIGGGKEEEPPKEVTHVEPATVGTWGCSSEANGGAMTLIIELKEDGTFRFGPVSGFENNHIEGTFNSNLIGEAEDGEEYDAYGLTMKQTKIIDNGNITEGEANVTYSVGINKEGDTAIFSSGNGNTSYYCTK